MWEACTKDDIASRFKGTVTLRLVVDRKGKPHDIEVVKNLRTDLDKDALAQVREWRFQPATRNGKPVIIRIQAEVNYDCTAIPKYSGEP
jgi:periplasmic protein TonB